MGYVQPTVVSVTPMEIVLEVNPVLSPNGVVGYLLYVEGDFPSSNASLVGGVVTMVRMVAVGGGDMLPRPVQISGLVPFTNYSITLEASNGAGTLTGSPFTVATEPARESL